MDRIIIADDHPLFRAALRSAVERAVPGAEMIEFASLAEVENCLSRQSIDLVLLDLKLSDSEGMAGLNRIRSSYPMVPVAVVSASEEPVTVRRAMSLGAAGFIPKSTSLPDMVSAITAIMAGDNWAPEVGEADPEENDIHTRLASLTPSQLRILEGLKAGRLNKQIAFDLGVTEATIKAHLTSVFRKLGVHNRTQAVILAQTLNIN